jgi:hypothetical protein
LQCSLYWGIVRTRLAGSPVSPALHVLWSRGGLQQPRSRTCYYAWFTLRTAASAMAGQDTMEPVHTAIVKKVVLPTVCVNVLFKC